MSVCAGEMSQRDVAAALGLSRRQVVRAEESALRKLRAALRDIGIHEYEDLAVERESAHPLASLYLTPTEV